MAITEMQINLIRHAILLAGHAQDDLTSSSTDQGRAAPSIRSVTNTMSRLSSIIRTLEAAL